MRTLLRRVALWVLGISADQLDSPRQRTTQMTGADIAACSITGDKIAAGSIASYSLAPRSVTFEHLSDEVRERLNVHPVVDNMRASGSMLHPSRVSSGRLAPQRPVMQQSVAADEAQRRFGSGGFPSRTMVGEGHAPEKYVPDVAARDGNGGGGQ